MFCEESLGKIKFTAFPEWVRPRIMSLESIDYFARCEHFSGRKKKKRRILISKTLIANFHCMQMSLVMSVWVYFWQ